MDNPYIFRGPVHAPEMFFGRVHELKEVAAFLRGNQSVSIVGPRKIGKTSLLFHLMRPEAWPAIGLAEDHLFVYLDCEVLGEGDPGDILGQFSGEIAAALEERGLPPEMALDRSMDKPSRLSFEAAIRKLNQRGLRVVLILDEFERLSTNSSLDVNFFNALRSAAGRYQLAYLTASAHPLIHLTYSGRSKEILSSPFFNIFAPLFLGFLAEDEARRMIAVPARDAGRPFSREMEDWIYDLVGGHPLALQVVCFHAFEKAGDLEAIEREAMQELAPHFQYYWHNLAPEEQGTLRRMNGIASRAANDTTLRGILRDLVQKCMLVVQDEVYQYPSRAWKSFVAGQGMASLTLARPDGSLAGARLGTYEVLELLGRGGMAEVYKGRHPRLERIVAIKILPASLAEEVDFRQRFEREARAVAALRHSNIVQVFDFGDIDGVYYMVMEFIDGVDLARVVRQSGALPLPWALVVLRDVVDALDYAHGQGLIHRDIKPSNVMLTGELVEEHAIDWARPPDVPAATLSAAQVRAILTDFGIAKMRTSDTGATKTGVMMGTLDYMAPEQVRVSSQVDQRADIYALGAMFYQMLAGELPFKGDNPGAVMLAHLQQPPPDLRAVVPEMPENVAAAIIRAMAKEPEQRFSTAGEFLQAIVKRET
ncbi:MAG: protein kinase [Anaerolineae bacterium]|nr:protein kinase [Anaerolineae bacterium]